MLRLMTGKWEGSSLLSVDADDAAHPLSHKRAVVTCGGKITNRYSISDLQATSNKIALGCENCRRPRSRCSVGRNHTTKTGSLQNERLLNQ